MIGMRSFFDRQKMNLTAVKEENEVIEGDLNVVDVGSGVGLPGVILAMACPSTVHDLY